MSESILSRRVSEVQKARAERRKAMTECAAFIDAMRIAFPDLKILHAKENGHEWGEEQAQGIPLSECVLHKPE